MNYYNENDPKAAAWLNELIASGVLPMGYVDTRSIVEVQPDDLIGFTQCHFFAGIGGWPLALQLAGWPEDALVWTGSCPCQPFSCAGKQKGVEDERHLWPEYWRLIGYGNPPVLFGEQVASPAGRDWLDNVSDDLEALGYEVGSADLCAAGVGSPNIRSRLWFVADTSSERIRARGGRSGFAGATRELESAEDQRERFRPDVRNSCADSGVADTMRSKRRSHIEQQARHEQAPGRDESADRTGECGQAVRMGDTGGSRSQGRDRGSEPIIQGREIGIECAAGEAGVAGGLEDADSRMCRKGRRAEPGEAHGGRSCGGPSGPSDTRIMARRTGRDGRGLTPEPCAGPALVNGFWRDAGWVLCRPERRGGDPCWRPVEPGTFPLADGVQGRSGLLRGYGNAINPHVAAGFIEAYREARGIVFDNLDFIR